MPWYPAKGRSQVGLAGVLLFILMRVGPASIAQDTDFARVQELYADLECEKALKLLRTLATERTWQQAERAQIAMWEGLCHAQLSANDARDQAIRSALELDPTLQLPPYTPPKVAEAFEAARRELPHKPQRDDASTGAPASPPSGAPDSPAASTVSRPAEGSDALAWAGRGAMVLGGTALLGGVVCAGLAVPNGLTASDPEAFQTDAIARARLANQQLSLAGGLWVTGAFLLGGGFILERGMTAE